MKTMRTVAIVLAASLVALTACSTADEGSSHSSVFQHLSIDNHGNVIALARDGREATVTPAGDLVISGKPLAVTLEQRQLLETYRNAALELRDDGVATGKAGVHTGIHAIGAVASGLASGDPDSIGAKVNANADKVGALAREVCKDLARLYALQGKLTVAIPAFQPYATIERREVSGCRVD